MHSRYQEWLAHVFDHPVGKEAWHWGSKACFEGDEAAVAVLLEETFTHSGKDLLRFTDAQVNQGIYYLARPSEGGFLDALTSGAVPLDHRLRGIRSIETLYRDCFAGRCSEALTHLNEKGSPLNAICYMFWDLNTLSYLENIPEREIIGSAIFQVLESLLRIPHVACQEAALHGLGHLFNGDPEVATSIMDRFLETEIRKDELRVYAMAAREGMVQ